MGPVAKTAQHLTVERTKSRMGDWSESLHSSPTIQVELTEIALAPSHFRHPTPALTVPPAFPDHECKVAEHCWEACMRIHFGVFSILGAKFGEMETLVHQMGARHRRWPEQPNHRGKDCETR